MNKFAPLKIIIIIALIFGALFLSLNPLQEGINLGLDLQGGAQVVLQAVPEEGQAITDQDMDQLMEVMRRRVDEFGVSEPILQREGNDRLIIELAGVDNPEQALELLGRTAKLEFLAPDGEVILSGSHLEDATAQIITNYDGSQSNIVSLKFNSEGSQLFADATASYLGQAILISLDGEIISSPQVNTVITGGEAMIEGGFTTFEEAAELASLLRGGALPVDIVQLSQNIVGPTLGQDSLAKSLNASLIGLVVLAGFMLLVYRIPGLWAALSLIVYSLLLLWALNMVNATLTLTSIAGFILSIGVAVDANIIIFERIKEEMYHGKSLKASIESGFKRAFATILDSNITTLIAAIVLYYFGSGTIKGFALTLSLGIIASMFTAITFTRYMLRFTSDIKPLAHKPLFGMNKKQFIFKIDFMRLQKVWYIIAALIIIPGLLMAAFSGLNQGIDFTGGSILQIRYDQEIELVAVREVVNQYVEQTPSIQVSDNNSFLIRSQELSIEQSEAMLAALGELAPLSVERSELIGPVIGAELLLNAQWAILIAGILMLTYISLRFQFNFAITAIIALLHDVLVIISVFAIAGIEVDSAFIAAILTVLGYSINNTIVVFDRIRENIAYNEKMGIKDLINLSLNQTITRSINTVLAVLFLLLALLFFGGETTHAFILALTVGIIGGFYSSLFLVGSILENISRKKGLIVHNKKVKIKKQPMV